jgi:histidinol-phosphate aminotransferase
MIPIFARMNGLVPVEVPLRPDFSLDADAMLDTGARVIYVCSPNNPTGTLLERAALERVIERAPGMVIVDEAYAEFVGGGMDGDAGFLRRAAELPNVLVVRTMSKAFGLAGCVSATRPARRRRWPRWRSRAGRTR